MAGSIGVGWTCDETPVGSAVFGAERACFGTRTMLAFGGGFLRRRVPSELTDDSRDGGRGRVPPGVRGETGEVASISGGATCPAIEARMRGTCGCVGLIVVRYPLG